MSETTSSIANTSYVNKDFQTIFPELLGLVKNLTTKWDPSLSNESDPGVILLKLNAILGDKLNYNIDKNVLECFPLSVTQERNARQMYEQLGYKMHWYEAPTTTISMKWIGDSSSTYVNIPAFTMISDADTSVIYTLLGPTNTTVNQTYPIATQSLVEDSTVLKWTAMQGTAVVYDINGTTTITAAHLDSNNRLYFNYDDIAQNGVFITNVGANNYSDWIQKDTLLTENLNNKYYSFGVSQDTSTVYLEFPEDAENIFKEGIEITYIRTKGVEGNVPPLTMEKFYSDVTLTDSTGETIVLNSDNVFLTNYAAATNGSDKETIDEAYKNYGRTVGTFDTLVTLRDYINYIVSNKLASNGFAADRSADPQCCYDVIVNNDGVSQNQTLVDTVDSDSFYTATGEIAQVPGLSAFDLKLYLLKYTDDLSDVYGYDATFTPMSATEKEVVEDYIEDQKSISHDYQPILELNNTRSNICFVINTYPVTCRIVTKYQLTNNQAEEVRDNIVQALFANLNSQEIEFGQNITIELINDIIVDADSRVKSASIDNIDYTTNIIYWDQSYVDNSGTEYGSFKMVDISSDDRSLTDYTYTYLVNDTTSGGATIKGYAYKETGRDPSVHVGYDKYEYCIYNGHRYICTRDTWKYGRVTGNFYSSYWEQCDIDLNYTEEGYETLVTKLGYGSYKNISATFNQTTSKWSWNIEGSNETITDMTVLGIGDRQIDYYINFSGGGKTYRIRNTHYITLEELASMFADSATYSYNSVTGSIIYTTATSTFNIYNALTSSATIKLNKVSGSTTTTVTITVTEGQDPESANTISDSYNYRISVSEQVRDEIYTKSVLRGSTPLFINDDDIDYRFSHFKDWDRVVYTYNCAGTESGNTYKFTIGSTTYSFVMPTVTSSSVISFDDTLSTKYLYLGSVYSGTKITLLSTVSGTALTFTKTYDTLVENVSSPIIEDVSKMVTNVDISFYNHTSPVSSSTSYKLQSNETIQMYRPNIITKRTYSGSVKMEHDLLNDVAVNEDYQLSTNEFVAFYWKENGDDDEYYKYYIYGPGTIIKPSFKLLTSKNATDPTIVGQTPIYQRILGSGGISNMRNVGTTANPIYEQDSSNYVTVSDTINALIAELVKAYNILSGTKNIGVRQINQMEINQKYLYYIISNTVDADTGLYYFQFGTDSTKEDYKKKILNTGEYLIYTNAAQTEYNVLGSGTVLTEEGVTETVEGVSVPGKLTSVPVTLAEVLTDGLSFLSKNEAWNQLPTDATLTIQENQFTNISPGNYVVIQPKDQYSSILTDWSIAMDREGTTFTSTSTTADINFSYFKISYGSSLTSLTELESVNLAGYGWSGRTLLSYNSASDVEQILYDNQEITLTTVVGNTYTIHGADLVTDTLEDVDTLAKSSWYRSCLLSSAAVEFSGEGEFTPVQYDSSGALFYPKLYLTSKNVSNTRVSYTSDGDVVLSYPICVSDTATNPGRNRSFKFNLPDGDYIVKFTNSSSTIDSSQIVVTITDADGVVTTVDSMYGNGISKNTFLKLNFTTGFNNAKTLNVRVPSHSETITITLENPYKYVKPSGMSDFYFYKISSILKDFDINKQFDYTFEVSNDNKIEDPLLPANFLNENHPYYKYTICKIDTSIDFDSTIQILNQK